MGLSHIILKNILGHGSTLEWTLTPMNSFILQYNLNIFY